MLLENLIFVNKFAKDFLIYNTIFQIEKIKLNKK